MPALGLSLALSSGGVSPLAAYTREGNAPPLIAGFASGVYGINGVAKTLAGVVPTHTCPTVHNYVNYGGMS